MDDRRNYGIDLLRGVAMLFIITIHSLQHGELLDAINTRTYSGGIINILFSIVNCGVDVFAIVSGYVGIQRNNGKVNWKAFVKLWTTAVCYSILIYFFFAIKAGTLSAIDFFKQFVPIAVNRYWYLTSYLFVVIFSPVINWLVRMTNRKHTILHLALSTAGLYYAHFIQGLFSIYLLLYLYYVGAVAWKYQIAEKCQCSRIAGALLLLVGFMSIWRIVVLPINKSIGGIVTRYDSPLVIAEALCLLCLFASCKIEKSMVPKLLHNITPSVFSVYLMNDHPIIRSNIVKAFWTNNTNANAMVLFGQIIMFSVCFFAIAVSIDQVRICVANALPKVLLTNKLAERITKMMMKRGEFIVALFKKAFCMKKK